MNKPVRPLIEIYADVSTAKPGRQARKLHRELKYYGDGLGFLDRYMDYLVLIGSVIISMALAGLILAVCG